LVCFVDTLPCAAQVDGLTLWVKRTDFRDAPYFITRHVARDCLVADFIARWVASEKLDVTPSLVSLRLVKRGPDRLTKDQASRLAAEEAATTLDPADTLAEAGVSDGSWLLAVFAQAAPSAGAPRALHTGYD
jgi:hypothetical protein